MATPRVLILRAPGANCDLETQFAFEQAGSLAERVHINRLREEPRLLQRYQIDKGPSGSEPGLRAASPPAPPPPTNGRRRASVTSGERVKPASFHGEPLRESGGSKVLPPPVASNV